MIKKYEILENERTIYKNKVLFRIKSLIDFDDVKKGDKGGYIESESNLSHEGNCWVYGEAKVSVNARVYENAKVYNNSIVTGFAEVYGNARILDNAYVGYYAKVYNNATVCNNSIVSYNSDINSDAIINGDTWLGKNAKISKRGDFISINGLITLDCPVTFYRTSDNTVSVIDTTGEYKTLKDYEKVNTNSIQTVVINSVRRHFKGRGLNV